jgi:hypothetical protein
MKALTGAIIVLAGAVLAGAGAVAAAPPRAQGRVGGSEAGLAGAGGGALILIGLLILVLGSMTDNRGNGRGDPGVVPGSVGYWSRDSAPTLRAEGRHWSAYPPRQVRLFIARSRPGGPFRGIRGRAGRPSVCYK